MVVLEVPEGANQETLRHNVEFDLNCMGHKVVSVIPMRYTIDVPEGSITA